MYGESELVIDAWSGQKTSSFDSWNSFKVSRKVTSTTTYSISKPVITETYEIL
mgnify:CR=1 FL=1